MKFLSLIFLLLMPALALSDVRLGQLNFQDYPQKGTLGGGRLVSLILLGVKP